jgi:hypothetical protein
MPSSRTQASPSGSACPIGIIPTVPFQSVPCRHSVMVRTTGKPGPHARGRVGKVRFAGPDAYSWILLTERRRKPTACLLGAVGNRPDGERGGARRGDPGTCLVGLL